MCACMCVRMRACVCVCVTTRTCMHHLWPRKRPSPYKVVLHSTDLTASAPYRVLEEGEGWGTHLTPPPLHSPQLLLFLAIPTQLYTITTNLYLLKQCHTFLIIVFFPPYMRIRHDTIVFSITECYERASDDADSLFRGHC